jgi:ADP-ribose pyrophosphatase YjhB (NUDIX family)
MVEMHDTVCIAARYKSKVFLVRRLNEPCRGLWSLPGGHVDQGETPDAAARREAEEEIQGARIISGPDPIFTHGVPEGEWRHQAPHRHLCHVFHAISRGSTITGSDAGEGKWFTIDEALALPDLETSGYSMRVLQHLRTAREHLLHPESLHDDAAAAPVQELAEKAQKPAKPAKPVRKAKGKAKGKA